MEGGLKQAWKRMREEESRVKGAGMGRVVKWNRKARVAYVLYRTGKGNLKAWRHKIGKTENSQCRKCGRYAETGKHVALVCTHGEDIGWRWNTWEDIDDRARWARTEKDEKGFYTFDLVEMFFTKIDLRWFPIIKNFVCVCCVRQERAGRGVEVEDLYMYGEGPEGA